KKTGADAVKTEKFVPDGIFDNFDKNETVAKNTKNTVSGEKTVLEKVDDVLPKNNIVAEEVSAGIRLSIRDIKFAPDSAQILSGESERLDEIAEVLKMAPNAQLLVEGHTASVGKPAGEQKLSEQRAHKIAEELKARGVKAGAFICRGFGGTKPVASNETNEGRAQNRRVEITILK
ncbi:OmpA family protein, partial [Treponema berlinense]|uniref:OmpA family protein n=2 Tax=Treponema TaxID=157 RepID=UPI0023F6AB6B